MNKNTLRSKIVDVIDKYGLTYKSYDEEEDLAPANVEYDLVNDILDVVSDEVSEFIVKEE